MRPLLVPILLLAAAFAGCADEAPASEPDLSPVAAAFATGGSRVETFVLHGNISGALFLTTLPGDDGTVLEVPVGANATRIVATLTWTGAGADLDAALAAPGHCPHDDPLALPQSLACVVMNDYGVQEGPTWHRARGGTPAAPDSPSVLEVGPDAFAAHPCERRACAWHAVAYFNTAAQASFSYVVEVTYPPGDPGTGEGLTAGAAAA